MITIVTVKGRHYTVNTDLEDDSAASDNVLADVFNSRGEWSGYLVRDSANAHNYMLFGSPFRSANTKAVARQAAKELGL